MTPQEIQEKITDLERKSQNKALPASAVKKLKEMMSDLKAKLPKEADVASSGKKPTSSKKDTVKSSGKKQVKLKPASKVNNSPDYDCDALVKKEKERHENAKKAAATRAAAPKKTETTKVKETLEKITDKVEKKYESGDLTKAQIVKMISEFRNKIKDLENLLKTVA